MKLFFKKAKRKKKDKTFLQKTTYDTLCFEICHLHENIDKFDHDELRVQNSVESSIHKIKCYFLHFSHISQNQQIFKI